MPKLFIPPDSITSKMLDVATRRKLNGLNNDTSIIAEQVVRSILEIPICGCISTTNITLSGVQTVDGVSTASIELICVNGNTDQTENGVYLVGSGAWTRYENMTAGCLVRVLGGTINELTWWDNDNTVLDYGTTNITFSYLLSEASIATLTDVTLTSLANNQILLYNSATGKWVNSTYAGLPTGTDNQTLWNNAGVWTATSKLYVDIGGTANQYRVRSPSSDSVYINVITYDDIVSVNGNIGSNNGFILDSSNTAGASQLKLINAYSYAWLRNKIFDATKKCILITSGGASGITDERFLVYMDGTIMSNILTASTLLQANASKEIVSLANAAGYLYNDGAGVLSYGTPSGLLPSGTVTGSILYWNGTNWIEFVKALITTSATQNGFRIYEPDYTAVPLRRSIGSLASTTSVYSDWIYDSEKLMYINIDSSSTGVVIRSKNSYLNFGAAETMAASSIFIQSTYGGATRFKLMRDGDIFSNYYAGTGDRYLGADSTGNFKVMTDPPENHVGFNADGIGAFQTYSNLNSGLTTLVDMANITVTLLANKYYQMNVVLVLEFAHVDYADNVEFELNVAGTSTVVNYAILRQNCFSFGDATGQTTNQMVVNTAKAFIKTGGTDGFANRVLCEISGVISGGVSGGVLKLQARVTGSGEADGTLSMKVLGGSTINAIECSIN